MGFKNDKLQRKKYADILTEIIDKPEKYKRNSDSDSFTMAIDSSWGTGKTEFLKMWEEELKEHKSEEGKEKYIVISYNAWENDFSENPLETVIYSILTNPVFDVVNDKENGKEGIKSAFETIIKFSKKVLPGGEILQTGIQGIQEIGKIMDQETCMDEMIREYIDYKEMLTKVKKLLEKITEQTKIIVMVDELDRCKPLFAIKLLEAIKHIFNVKNMNFVFALDMTQLSYSVKKVYGTEIDAAGYICRFFDYITKMPKPNLESYISYIMDKRPPIRKEVEVSSSDPNYRFTIGDIKWDLKDVLINFSQVYNLSLRDVNTIYNNFLVLEERELKEIETIEGYALHLYFLLLKYKNLEVFNQIFITNDVIEGKEPDIEKLDHCSWIKKETIYEISRNQKIGDMHFKDEENTRYRIRAVNKNTTSYKVNYGPSRVQSYVKKFDTHTALSFCFFYPDLINYNEIKEKTLAQHIHEKLELFDFEWDKHQEKIMLHNNI